jgi:hypothetical protein
LKLQKELLAKHDFELFPEPLAKKFSKDDEWIIGNSKPMTGPLRLKLLIKKEGETNASPSGICPINWA